MHRLSAPQLLPARIFMGNGVALMLGFILGTISIHSSFKAPAAVAILVPILALGLPVIETLLLMLVRFRTTSRGSIASRFAGMFRADNQHLHHVMSNYATHHYRIVVGIWVWRSSSARWRSWLRFVPIRRSALP